jgi:hypothetical protein
VENIKMGLRELGVKCVCVRERERENIDGVSISDFGGKARMK